MYWTLHLACIGLFWASVPLLLVYRARRSDVPWAFVIVMATVLGWILINASVFFQHAAIDQQRIEEKVCSAAPQDSRNQRAPVVDERGMTETTVENPCGIGEYWPDKYKPWLGLLYGPLYLLCCALPYWLMVVPRPSIKNRLHIVLLAVGFLVIEWAVILGECTGLFGERDSYYPPCYYIDSYIALPLTIALASFVSWAVTTQVLQRFKRGV